MKWTNYSDKIVNSNIEEEYGVSLMKNDDGKYALFRDKKQFSIEFGDSTFFIEQGGPFSDCLFIYRGEYVNYMFMATGAIVLPYWANSIDRDEIKIGEYTGYAESNIGVSMKCETNSIWMEFNWDKNSYYQSPEKIKFDEMIKNKMLTSENAIEIGNYLYSHNITLFNKYVNLMI